MGGGGRANNKGGKNLHAKGGKQSYPDTMSPPYLQGTQHGGAYHDPQWQPGGAYYDPQRQFGGAQQHNPARGFGSGGRYGSNYGGAGAYQHGAEHHGTYNPGGGGSYGSGYGGAGAYQHGSEHHGDAPAPYGSYQSQYAYLGTPCMAMVQPPMAWNYAAGGAAYAQQQSPVMYLSNYAYNDPYSGRSSALHLQPSQGADQSILPPLLEPADEAAVEALPLLIETVGDLQCLLKRLQRENFLFIDCEGSDLSKGSWRNGERLSDSVRGCFHGKVCLLQVGVVEEEASSAAHPKHDNLSGGRSISVIPCKTWAIDLLAIENPFDVLIPEDSQKTSLRSLLESPSIVKVGHDLRSDADALYHQHLIDVTSNVFDSQMVDVLIRRLKGTATRFVRGSAKLLQAYQIPLQSIALVEGGELNQEQKQRIHAMFSDDRHLWEKRPLPDGMVEYAVADVIPLPTLKQELETELDQLCGRGQWQSLVATASSAYAKQFMQSADICYCRLCRDAQANARFDGLSVIQHGILQAYVPSDGSNLVHRIGRPEDTQMLEPAGPTKWRIDENSRSVPIE